MGRGPWAETNKAEGGEGKERRTPLGGAGQVLCFESLWPPAAVSQWGVRMGAGSTAPESRKQSTRETQDHCGESGSCAPSSFSSFDLWACGELSMVMCLQGVGTEGQAWESPFPA